MLTTTVRTASLWGRDHDRLGVVADAPLGEAGGLALSCGASAKPYDTVDPNEDVVFGALGPAGAVLAVADGSSGAEAAEAAIEGMITATSSRLLLPGAPAAMAMDIYAAAGDAVQRMRSLVPASRRSSRTAFSIVVAASGLAAAATRGDTAVVLIRDRDVRVLSGVAPGDHQPPTLPLPQQAETSPGDVLMVASDGFFDFAGPDWPKAAAAAICDCPTLRDAARGLVGVACDAGAGDNVSVGLLRLR